MAVPMTATETEGEGEGEDHAYRRDWGSAQAYGHFEGVS